MKKKFLVGLAIGFLMFGMVGGASAGLISWTDWTSVGSAAPGVFGTLVVGASTVEVTFGGAYAFAQTTGGANYWAPDTPYLSSVVDNAPPASDIIALGTGGLKTITFSQTVQDPLLALVSWNGNVVDFGVPIDILSFGTGFWGTGTPTLNAAGTGFTGSGEVHGVIRLPGSFDSISFTDSSEYWHGFTIGVVGLSTENPIPEPSTMILLGFGIIGLAGVARKKMMK